MDPFTLLAAVTTAFNGVKKVVEVGKEVEGVYRQLSKWADAAGQLQDYINANSEKKPGLFEKIGFDKSDTAEAFDVFAAQQRLKEMEAEIYHMFTWGELNHLGLEGHREFVRLRREVREKREKMVRDQAARRKRFIENLFWGTMLTIVIAGAIKLSVALYEMGKEAGKW
jgi:hypothetical protein